MSIRFNPSYLIELPSGSQTRVTLHDSGVTIDAVSLKSVGESSVAASLLIVCTATAAALPLRAVDWPMVGSDLSRNALSAEKDPPTFWRIQADTQWKTTNTSPEVRWKATLVGISFADPSLPMAWFGLAQITRNLAILP
jgi:hypothetical protein